MQDFSSFCFEEISKVSLENSNGYIYLYRYEQGDENAVGIYVAQKYIWNNNQALEN